MAIAVADGARDRAVDGARDRAVGEARDRAEDRVRDGVEVRSRCRAAHGAGHPRAHAIGAACTAGEARPRASGEAQGRISDKACGCATDKASRHSLVRRLDPRVSLAIIVLLNAIAFAPTRIGPEVAAVGLCAACMLACGRVRPALRWLVAYAAVFAATQLIVAFPNPALMSFSVIVVVVRRVFCVGMFASNMVATTRVGEMAAALQRLRVPRGGVVCVSVALRFFPTIGREFVAVGEALAVRGMGLTPARVLRHPARCVEQLMVPAMSRMAIVADELGNAAIVRGIDSDAPRTSYYELRLGVVDALALVTFLADAAYVALTGAGVIA